MILHKNMHVTHASRRFTRFDFVEIAPYGVIRVAGWSPGQLPEIVLKYGERLVGPSATYRRHRPDVAAYLREPNRFHGFSIEFRILDPEPCTVMSGDVMIHQLTPGQAAYAQSHQVGYRELLDESDVLHREDVYSEGPPSTEGHPDIVALALQLRGPILDFGCGNGYMFRHWREAGQDATGIEIDRPAIREAMLPEAAGRITLYDGSFPLPFADGQFESAFSSEVIEHVPDYRAAIAELARVCRTALAVTVPDMSCIPIGSVSNLVPWHLLEATHVNFFNQKSLAAVLGRHFTRLDFFNLAPGMVDGNYVPGSIGCLATK